MSFLEICGIIAIFVGIPAGAIAIWKFFFSENGDESDFLKHLKKINDWKEEFSGTEKFWILKKNPKYQIHFGEKINSEFWEDWMKVFADKENNSSEEVFLKFNGNLVKNLTFLFGDGGRYLIPVPDRRIENEKVFYFWNEDSIEFKVGEVIGQFYREKNLKDVAKLLKIQVVKI